MLYSLLGFVRAVGDQCTKQITRTGRAARVQREQRSEVHHSKKQIGTRGVLSA